MARKRNRQVDPFSAGDPIMPWDRAAEYVPVEADLARQARRRGQGLGSPSGSTSQGDATPVTFSSHDECWLENGSADTPKPSKHRAPKDKRSRSKSSKPRKSAPRRESGTTQDASPDPVERAKGQKRANRGARIVKLCIALVLFGVIAPAAQCAWSFVTASSSSSSSSSSGSSYSSGDVADHSDEIADKQLEAATQRLGSVQDDDALVTQGGQQLDYYFKGYTGGISLAQAGIDPTELARWMLASASATPNSYGSSAYEDGDNEYKGRVYFDVKLADKIDLPYELATYLDKDILDYEPLPASGLTAEQKARMASKLEEIKQRGNTDSTSIRLEFEGSWDESSQSPRVTLDEDEFNEQIRELFGIYDD